jgi:hypothetical protein
MSRLARNLSPIGTLLFLLLHQTPAPGQEVPSPAEVLGYELGERFTPVAGVSHYLSALAESSDLVSVHRYGTTMEGRPLLQVLIASAAHRARLEEILALNRELTNPETSEARASEIIRTNPAVVYLSYGVHGNESSSSEAAMWTAYDLARGAEDLAGALDSVTVIIDPVVNPDGRDRYVNFYPQARSLEPNPDRSTREHSEPWPGGRPNHYLFDLNRDWAWMSQPETKARLATWDRWNPQVHGGLHEMGSNSSYFFFPAAKPINPIFPEHILEWGRRIGEGNARAFDEEGWLYYTAQGIQVERAEAGFRAQADPHRGFEPRQSFPAGTFLVRARQPRGRLAGALLMPELLPEGTSSYDITAWSLPYAYGVEAHSLTGHPGGDWAPVGEMKGPAGPTALSGRPYGYLLTPGFDIMPGLVRFLKAGGRAYSQPDTFRLGGRLYPQGTFFLPRGRNEKLEEKIRDGGLSPFVVPIVTGLTEPGLDLGTGSAAFVTLPKVALVAGEGVSSGSYGAHWFFLEQTLKLPFDAIDLSSLSGVDLTDYDVVVVPEGRGLQGALGERGMEALQSWLRGGNAGGSGEQCGGFGPGHWGAGAEGSRRGRSGKGRGAGQSSADPGRAGGRPMGGIGTRHHPGG